MATFFDYDKDFFNSLLIFFSNKKYDTAPTRKLMIVKHHIDGLHRKLIPVGIALAMVNKIIMSGICQRNALKAMLAKVWYIL